MKNLLYLGAKGQTESQEDLSFQLASTCDSVWPGLYTIGSKSLHHFFIKTEVKPKPIATRPHKFSRALRQLREITSRFDWFTGMPESFVIG